MQKGLGYRRVTTNFSGRAFDYRPPGIRDPNASDLDRVAAGSHDLALYCREPVAHQVEQFGCETCKK